MMPSADPSNPQYSMIPQLATQMSTLHLGTGSVSIMLSFNWKCKNFRLQNQTLLNWDSVVTARKGVGIFLDFFRQQETTNLSETLGIHYSTFEAYNEICWDSKNHKPALDFQGRISSRSKQGVIASKIVVWGKKKISQNYTRNSRTNH